MFMFRRKKPLKNNEQRANANVDQREFHARGNSTRFQFQLVISRSSSVLTNRATVGEFSFENQIILTFGRKVLQELSIYITS